MIHDGCVDKKIAFFDIDGVLSIPRYLNTSRHTDGNKYVPGGTDRWWKSYCEENEHPYEACIVPHVIKVYLSDLLNSGCELFVLSQESFDAAERGKRDFIKMRYSREFNDDHVCIVKTNNEKISTMIRISEERHIPKSHVEYWDDTFSNVLLASTTGIDAHHISEMLTWTIYRHLDGSEHVYAPYW